MGEIDKIYSQYFTNPYVLVKIFNDILRHLMPSTWLTTIQAKKLLDDLLENNIEIVRTHGSHLGDAAQSDVGGIKLFRKAPPGITLDTVGMSSAVFSSLHAKANSILVWKLNTSLLCFS